MQSGPPSPLHEHLTNLPTAGSFVFSLCLPDANPKLSGRRQLALQQNELRSIYARNVRPHLLDRESHRLRLSIPSPHHSKESTLLCVVDKTHARVCVRGDPPKETDDDREPENRRGEESQDDNLELRFHSGR